MELTGIFIFFGTISVIVLGLLGLIVILMRISKQGEKDLLEKMYKNGDIDNSIYRKYL